MKKKSFLTCVVMMLTLFFLNMERLNGNEIESDISKQADEDVVIAEFTKPLTPQELVNMARELNLTPKEIYYEMNGISGGYTLQPNEDVKTALKRMKEEHLKFLRFALKDNHRNLKSSAKRSKDEILGLNRLNKQLFRVLQDTQRGKFKLSGIKLEDDSFAPLLLEKGVIKDLSALPKDTPEGSSEEENKQKDIRIDSWYHESWAPFGGTSNVSQWQTYQTFYFNNTNGFDSTSTYEQETQIYDKNFADYGGYWSSNLPRGYKDSEFADTIDNFTIGSSQASDIRTYTRYYTYMGLRPGSVSTAYVIIKGQKGVRIPSWCHSPERCIFARATTNPGMARFTAPAEVKWIY